MDYTYKSPLQDSEHDLYERGHPPFRTSYHRDYKPYSRPTLSKQNQPSTYDRQKNIISVPTNQGAQTYSSRHGVSHYPKELNDMFGASECKLCQVEVTSPIVAKMHYSGNKHMKKVKNFLVEWSLKSGNSIDSYQHLITQPSVTTFPDYCELCDVRLLSTNDKIAHCSGKQHRKNERDPSNAKKKKRAYDTIDLSATGARFGIGADFSSNKIPDDIPDVKVKDFVCELCDVKAVSQEQLDIHFGGKNHQQRLKKKESGVPKRDRPFKCDICNVALKTYGLFNMHLKGKPHKKRVKKLEIEFKRESCKVCNIDFKTYREYHMHVNGKRHEEKCRQNAHRIPISIDKDLKAASTCKNCPYVGNMENNLCDGCLENKSIKHYPDATWTCAPCYNKMFDTKEEYDEHMKSSRHLLCMLSVKCDEITEEKTHLYCFVCRKQYNRLKEYCEHFFEHKHMTLTNGTYDLGNKTDLFYCSVCADIMDQQAKDKHMWSKSHLLQAARQDTMEILTKLATEELGTQTYYCTNCNSTFYSFVAYSDHLLGLEHLEKIIPAKLASETV